MQAMHALFIWIRNEKECFNSIRYSPPKEFLFMTQLKTLSRDDFKVKQGFPSGNNEEQSNSFSLITQSMFPSDFQLILLYPQTPVTQWKILYNTFPQNCISSVSPVSFLLGFSIVGLSPSPFLYIKTFLMKYIHVPHSKCFLYTSLPKLPIYRNLYKTLTHATDLHI